MRIGFDIDGVLAAFIPAYERMFELETGRNDFPPLDADGPPLWDWPSLYGYTKEETSAVWARIKSNRVFWSGLGTTADFDKFFWWYTQETLNDSTRGFNELYFVTSRPGLRPKQQTERWFLTNLGEVPTVLISDEKGLVAKALNLDYYVDDKLENIQSVEHHSPSTFAYLIDRQYNRHGDVQRRIPSLTDFLQVVSAHQEAATAA